MQLILTTEAVEHTRDRRASVADARQLRTAFGRKQANRQIARLVTAHPDLAAFPVRDVGVVEGVTPKLRQPALVLALGGRGAR